MTETKFPGTPQRSYRIRVEGSLDPSWSVRLAGLAITSTGKFGAAAATVLEGELADQSALMGVLNTLHELHLPVEAVEHLSAGAPDEGQHEAASKNT